MSSERESSLGLGGKAVVVDAISDLGIERYRCCGGYLKT
jgi:hypothetical protein